MLVYTSFFSGFKMPQVSLWRCFAVLTIFVSHQVVAQDIFLQDLNTRSLGQNKIEIKMDFDAPPPIPTAFELKNPNRVLIDMWGVENDTGKQEFSVESRALRSIDLVQVKGRLRLVANLNKLSDYNSFVEGKTLFIILDGDGKSTTSKSKKKPKSVVKEQRSRVKGIDFERAENGIGRVKINLSDDKAGVDIVEEGHNVVINLASAVLSDNLNQRLDVQDFATPVMFIDTFTQGQNTGILIKPTVEPYDYKAYQVGLQLIVDFSARKKKKKKVKN